MRLSIRQWRKSRRRQEGNMPYTLREENNKWCVYNKDTGENKGCSDSKEMAIQHMRALYAHEPGTKSGPLSLQMTITKAEKTSQGFIRWRARCNTGEVDAQNEKFDGSFWLDLVHNFMQVQKALSAAEAPPLPVPILDVAHYSMFLGSDRMKARAGWPNRLWIDGKALMAEGFYDDTPLGKASAAAGMRPDDKRPKISICVYPDWGNVSVEDGVLTYKGGRDVAYLDHLGQTMYPVNAGTDIVAEVPMEAKSTIADDAKEVLGDEKLAEELEKTRAAAKSATTVPEGAVIKADDTPKPETPPVAADAPVVEGQPVEKAARADVSTADKERAVKEYGNVTYADETNKKYPIDTEEHIRAAWSYINMPKNQAMYADKGAAIKAKIVAAWKKVIDPKGPPEAQKADAEPQPEAKSEASEKYDTLAKLVVSLSETLPKALQELSETVKGLQADVDALKVSDTAKVKSAIDSGGDWLKKFYNPRKDSGNVVPEGEVKKAEPKAQTGQMEGVWGYIADAVNKTPGG